MSYKKLRADGPREIRFRQLLLVDSAILGLPGGPNVLVGLDDFGKPWALASRGGANGWFRFISTELPEITPEERAQLEADIREATNEAGTNTVRTDEEASD